MSGLSVLELTDPRWEKFVAGQPPATPFHHPDWARLIADCYGFRAFAVATSETTKEIRAGLPVVEGRHLIRTACEQGSLWFDFGRTDVGNGGLRVFKRSWGAVEEPLVCGTLGVGPEPAPVTDGMAGHLLASVIRHGPPVPRRTAGGALYRYGA